MHSLGTNMAVASEGQQPGSLVQPTSMAEGLSVRVWLPPEALPSVVPRSEWRPAQAV